MGGVPADCLASTLATPELVEWSATAARQNKLPQVLVAVGSLRLARQFDEAVRILADFVSRMPWQVGHGRVVMYRSISVLIISELVSR